MQIKTTVHQIADFLRKAIFEGKYQPGEQAERNRDRVVVFRQPNTGQRIASHTGSRGVGRISCPTKGSSFRRSTIDDIEEICELRLLIEVYCMRKFIQIATERHFEEMEGILDQMKSALESKDIPSYFALSLDFHDYYIKNCQNRQDIFLF